jgi:hypothetical protein
MGAAQLTEQHSHELAPTGEPASVTLRFMLANCCFELYPGKQLQQLAENAAYSIHGGSLAFGDLVLGRTQFTLAKLSPLLYLEIIIVQKRNLDTSEKR